MQSSASMKKFLTFTAALFFVVTGFSQRFTGVEWKVHKKPGLTNEFTVDMILTRKNGKSVTIYPGNADFRAKSFRFEYEGLSSLDDGAGTFSISRDLTGVDSVVVKAVSEKLELSSEFKVPVLYCKALRLDNKTMEYNSSVRQRLIMLMNDGLQAPYDPIWLDTSILLNESDTSLHVRNDTLTANIISPVKALHVKFTHKTSGAAVIDYFMAIAYPLNAAFEFAGPPGRNGRDGAAASASGRSGFNGENGENGYAALPVAIYLRKIQTADSLSLIEAIAICGSDRKRQFLSSSATTINIQAKGGNGGTGGKGGMGGSSEQTQKETDHMVRNAGNGGMGGAGGHGGKGSDVTIIVENTLDASSLLMLDNSGGTGGQGGNGGSDGASNSITTASGTVNLNGEPGQAGKPGANGPGGVYSGISYVSPEDFSKLLRRSGWQ